MITDDSLAGVARYLGFHQWPHEYTKAGRSFVVLADALVHDDRSLRHGGLRRFERILSHESSECCDLLVVGWLTRHEYGEFRYLISNAFPFRQLPVPLELLTPESTSPAVWSEVVGKARSAGSVRELKWVRDRLVAHASDPKSFVEPRLLDDHFWGPVRRRLEFTVKRSAMPVKLFDDLDVHDWPIRLLPLLRQASAGAIDSELQCLADRTVTLCEGAIDDYTTNVGRVEAAAQGGSSAFSEGTISALNEGLVAISTIAAAVLALMTKINAVEQELRGRDA